MVESESEEGERFGYEMIGRAIAAWCKLDQELRRWTLLSNDPQGSSPFLTGKLEREFEERVRAWFEMLAPDATSTAKPHCQNIEIF